MKHTRSERKKETTEYQILNVREPFLGTYKTLAAAKSGARYFLKHGYKNIKIAQRCRIHTEIIDTYTRIVVDKYVQPVKKDFYLAD